MQHLGLCEHCHSPYRQYVYTVTHPTTGQRLLACAKCERAFAQQREPSMPREEYELADRSAGRPRLIAGG